MPIPPLRPPRAYAGDPPGPFSSDPAARRLRVFVDLDEVDRQADAGCVRGVMIPTSAPALTWALASRPEVEMVWLPRHDVPDGTANAVRLDDRSLTEDQLPFWITEGDCTTYRAVWPYAQWARRAETLASERGVDPTAVLSDVTAAALAGELRVDVHITDRTLLLDTTDRRLHEANPMTAESALAVLGLYLRRRGKFALSASDIMTLGPGLYWWSAARAVLPAGWRWMSALVQHGAACDRDGPSILAGSLHKRIARVLRHRDDIYAVLQEPQNNSTGDAAAESLDMLLVNLVGAYDAAARAAHAAIGLPATLRRHAGWQKTRWLDQVASRHTDLAALYAPGTSHQLLLRACGLLRNTVHAESLHPMTVHRLGGEPQRTLLTVPDEDGADLVRLLNDLGGAEQWGVATGFRDQVTVDPETYVERLLPLALDSINVTLRTTPVEQLDGVTEGLRTQAPDSFEFGPGTRQRMRLMLGFPSITD